MDRYRIKSVRGYDSINPTTCVLVIKQVIFITQFISAFHSETPPHSPLLQISRVTTHIQSCPFIINTFATRLDQDSPQPLDLSEYIITGKLKPAARASVPLLHPWQYAHPMEQMLAGELTHVSPFSHLLFAYHALNATPSHLHRWQRHHRRR